MSAQIQASLTIDQIEIFIEGTGPQTIVMVPGWPDTYRLWDQQVAALKGSYRCVRFTLPGFDRQQPVRGYTHAQITAFIKKLIETVSPHDPVILLLHDWGAVYGYQFYMQNQSLVSHIIGVDVGNIQGEEFLNHLSLKEKLVIFIYQIWLAGAWRLGGRWGDAMTRLMTQALRCPSDPRFISSCMCHPYYVRWFGGLDSFDDLIPIDPACPMLYFYGRNKPAQFQTPQWLTRLAQKPGSGFHGMDTSHWIMLEQQPPLIH